MAEIDTQTILGAILIVLGGAKIVYAMVAAVRKSGFLWVRHAFYLEADEDSDPVGFRTVVWGNILQGGFIAALGLLFLFRWL